MRQDKQFPFIRPEALAIAATSYFTEERKLLGSCIIELLFVLLFFFFLTNCAANWQPLLVHQFVVCQCSVQIKAVCLCHC